jgi:hypothetical protein
LFLIGCGEFAGGSGLVMNEVKSSREAAHAKAFFQWMSLKGVSGITAVNELQSGAKLVQLFEKLESRQIKHWQVCKINMHRLENCDIAVKTAKAVGVRLENIGGRDLESGNTKLILAFLWTVICFYSEKVSACSSSSS